MCRDRSGKQIEVICGPMFSGKTTELIRCLREVERVGIICQAFKSNLDDRYSVNHLVAHNPNIEKYPCIAISQPAKIIHLLKPQTTLVAIDEVHLFNNWRELLSVAHLLANRDMKVILAGLDTDYRRVPFEWLLKIGNEAEIIRKEAICTICGKSAQFTQRINVKSRNGQRIVIGGVDIYEPRCQDCHQL